MGPEDGVEDPTEDCDDGDSGIYPEAEELCNWKDDDCDGDIDEDQPDTDESGVEDCKEVAVVATWGFQSAGSGGNCDGMSYLDREFLDPGQKVR